MDVRKVCLIYSELTFSVVSHRGYMECAAAGND